MVVVEVVGSGNVSPRLGMSAMSQIMDATYCIGGDMDFGRMFDQYLHKVSPHASGRIPRG